MPEEDAATACQVAPPFASRDVQLVVAPKLFDPADRPWTVGGPLPRQAGRKTQPPLRKTMRAGYHRPAGTGNKFSDTCVFGIAHGRPPVTLISARRSRAWSI